jgi:S-formylglutathione hydrolase FrmB
MNRWVTKDVIPTFNPASPRSPGGQTQFNFMNKRFLLSGMFLLCILFYSQAQKISATYTPSSFSGPFTGKVILYLSKEIREPRNCVNNVPPFCCYAIDVKDIKPNTPVVFDDAAVFFPAKLSDIERGNYYAQVVWDRNTGGRNIGASPDNMYNKSVQLNFTKNFKKQFFIKCDSVVQHETFTELPFMKNMVVHSDLLTSFYKRETTVNGAVNLPADYYTDSTRKFPVVFVILGFGGDYYWNSGDSIQSWNIDTFSCIHVFLDGNCSSGHSTYANSVNTGPWGDAFVKEFIPAVEKRFRCNGARFVTGHSSGGWASLWLQVNYPKSFTACWASSPDPVDFECLEMINIYKDKNMFYDNDSNLRVDGAVAGAAWLPWLFFKADYRIENVLYRGEQYRSWNAVWGGIQENGKPEEICNMETGEIDSVVASHWKKYDISYILRNNWKTLQPDLDGKIRITAGKNDNFQLDKAVMMLEGEMSVLHANITFVYYPGDHFSVFTDDYLNDGDHFFAVKYAEWLKVHPEAK